MSDRFWDELDTLSARLDWAEATHLRALSRGDRNTADRAQRQMNAVMAERAHLLMQLSAELSGG
jgi:hypothetical protein